MPDITFQGPEGRIEGKYFQAADPNAPIALVMHPHPQHGGTMNNKVTYRMFESFARCGFHVLRFNFRGVGNSEGVFDNGVGETNDAGAALDWLHAQHPHAKQIWVSGFSFGSWVMLQFLMRRPDIHRFIAVSTPAGNYDHSFFSPCPTSGMFLVGTNDEITPYEDVEAMLKKTARQKETKLHYSKIEGADHFYSNHQDELSKRLCQYIIANKA
tara:strand:+ start:155352 stop:155990 length:639 start_codon:yes stop_codon:yes gene_type:complete